MSKLKRLLRKLVQATPWSSAIIFRRIYRKDLWGAGSGPGSALSSTETYRNFLEDLLQTKKIRSVLDLGCGDWQFSKQINWGQIRYTGLDVVPAVIEQNRRLYGNDSITFRCEDFSKSELPPADLVLMKDVLQHWPNRMIRDFLPKFARFNYALITNDDHESPLRNQDCDLGGCRPVDLLAPPFGLKGSIVLRLGTDRQRENFPGKSVVLLDHLAASNRA